VGEHVVALSLLPQIIKLHQLTNRSRFHLEVNKTKFEIRAGKNVNFKDKKLDFKVENLTKKSRQKVEKCR